MTHIYIPKSSDMWCIHHYGSTEVNTHLDFLGPLSSFRSPTFPPHFHFVLEPHIFTLDRELVPEPLPIFHFALAHTYQNLG